jgi:hypothetical protein
VTLETKITTPAVPLALPQGTTANDPRGQKKGEHDVVPRKYVDNLLSQLETKFTEGITTTTSTEFPKELPFGTTTAAQAPRLRQQDGQDFGKFDVVPRQYVDTLITPFSQRLTQILVNDDVVDVGNRRIINVRDPIEKTDAVPHQWYLDHQKARDRVAQPEAIRTKTLVDAIDVTPHSMIVKRPITYIEQAIDENEVMTIKRMRTELTSDDTITAIVAKLPPPSSRDTDRIDDLNMHMFKITNVGEPSLPSSSDAVPAKYLHNLLDNLPLTYVAPEKHNYPSFTDPNNKIVGYVDAGGKYMTGVYTPGDDGFLDAVVNVDHVNNRLGMFTVLLVGTRIRKTGRWVVFQHGSNRYILPTDAEAVELRFAKPRPEFNVWLNGSPFYFTPPRTRFSKGDRITVSLKSDEEYPKASELAKATPFAMEVLIYYKLSSIMLPRLQAAGERDTILYGPPFSEDEEEEEVERRAPPSD